MAEENEGVGDRVEDWRFAIAYLGGSLGAVNVLPDVGVERCFSNLAVVVRGVRASGCLAILDPRGLKR